MAVPKKRSSVSVKRIRHSAWQNRKLKKFTNFLNILTCKNCGKPVLGHRVCAKCGYYGGKQVLTIKTKSKQNIIEA